MKIDELCAARKELSEQMLKELQSLMDEFKQKTGVAVRDICLDTNELLRMDGSRTCLILGIDIQLDLQIEPQNGIGANTLIRFEN